MSIQICNIIRDVQFKNRKVSVAHRQRVLIGETNSNEKAVRAVGGDMKTGKSELAAGRNDVMTVI